MQVIITDRNGVPITSVNENSEKAWKEAADITGKDQNILETTGYSAKIMLTEG